MNFIGRSQSLIDRRNHIWTDFPQCFDLNFMIHWIVIKRPLIIQILDIHRKDKADAKCFLSLSEVELIRSTHSNALHSLHSKPTLKITFTLWLISRFDLISDTFLHDEFQTDKCGNAFVALLEVFTRTSQLSTDNKYSRATALPQKNVGLYSAKRQHSNGPNRSGAYTKHCDCIRTPGDSQNRK